MSRLVVCSLMVSVMVLAGCGSEGSAPEQSRERDADAAADTAVCAADATPAPTPYGEQFPADWAFPPQSTVYDVEERQGTGTIVTAVSTAPFDDVLAFLNDDQPAAGYTITEGETEDDDAEANFTVDDYSGRWTIRSSATCEGETVVQVVAFSPAT